MYRAYFKKLVRRKFRATLRLHYQITHKFKSFLKGIELLKPLYTLFISGVGYLRFFKALIFRLFAEDSSRIESRLDVLFIFPNDFNLRGRNFNGGAKDIQSMYEQIKSLQIASETLLVSRRLGHAIYSLLEVQNRNLLKSSKRILISIPGSTGGIVTLLRLLGFKEIIYRSHNAEILHRIDWLRAARNFRTFKSSLKKLILGGISDFQVAIFASEILSVSQLENEIYWSRLFPNTSSKVHYFPGMSPAHISACLDIHDVEIKDRPLAVIVGGFHEGTLISKEDAHFVENGYRIQDFIHTKGLLLASVGQRDSQSYCDFNLGHVDDYEAILRKTSLIIVPTSLGWGFKTKIADAITLHQGVIVHRRLYNRLGDWKKMVTPIDNWGEISNLNLKEISHREYADFIDSLRIQRENYFIKMLK